MPTHGRELASAGSGRDASFAVGTPWPEPRFEMLHAGMLDRLTDLLWRRSADLIQQSAAWGEALAAVAKLNHEASETTWRLPTINEMESLVADVLDLYWSASTSLFEPDWAWAMYLEKGATGVGQKRFAQFSVWAMAMVG